MCAEKLRTVFFLFSELTDRVEITDQIVMKYHDFTDSHTVIVSTEIELLIIVILVTLFICLLLLQLQSSQSWCSVFLSVMTATLTAHQIIQIIGTRKMR